MAQKSIQIADKPTLDAAKALLEDSGVGLAAIKEAVSSGAASGSAGGLQIGKVVDEQVNGCVSVSRVVGAPFIRSVISESVYALASSKADAAEPLASAPTSLAE